MGDFSDIAFVVEDNIDVFVVYMFSALAADIPRFQIFGDGDGFITLCVFHKYLAHNFCLCFVYDVLLVFDNIPERRMTARCVTFEPTLPQAAVDFLFQVFREIFVEALNDGKKQLSFGRVGDILHCGYKFHAVVFELFAIDDRFVLVSGEPV